MNKQIKVHQLTLSSIYTDFNTLKKKSSRKTLWKKVEIAHFEHFTFFHDVFYTICILKSFDSHISVVISASLNLGQSQNGVLGNGLNSSTYLSLFVTETGYYIFIETSAPRKVGDKAWLKSGQVPATTGSCLTFWYNMYGTGKFSYTVE